MAEVSDGCSIRCCRKLVELVSTVSASRIADFRDPSQASLENDIEKPFSHKVSDYTKGQYRLAGEALAALATRAP